MAITYPLTLPIAPGFRNIVWAPQSVVGIDVSRFTYQQKKYIWDGQRRSGSANLPPMSIANAKIWQAFSLKLNGQEGSFFLRDSAPFRVPQGAIVDSYVGGIIDTGGGVAGTSVSATGFAISTVDLFKAGDYISMLDRLYQITDDADSNLSGDAVLNIWPFVRAPIADTTTIQVGSAAQGIFQLTGFPEFNWDMNRLMLGFTISFEEVL